MNLQKTIDKLKKKGCKLPPAFLFFFDKKNKNKLKEVEIDIRKGNEDAR